MELPVNGVRSVTSSGAIAAAHFGKTKGAAVGLELVFTPRLKLVTETGLRGKGAKKKITLIYRT